METPSRKADFESYQIVCSLHHCQKCIPGWSMYLSIFTYQLIFFPPMKLTLILDEPEILDCSVAFVFF